MRIVRLLPALALLTLLSGCASQTTVVKLKPDGSGTLEITQTLSPKMVQVMHKMAEATARAAEGSPDRANLEAAWQEKGLKVDTTGPGRPTATMEMFSEGQIKDWPKHMGAGVTFVRVDRTTDARTESVKAVFSFKDINTLRLPEVPLPAFSGKGGEFDKGMTIDPKMLKETVSFQLERPGETQVLTAIFPQPPAARAGPTMPKEMIEPFRKGIMPFAENLAGMRLALRVEVPGKVVKTDAVAREDNRVTLYDLKLDGLAEALKDDAKLGQFVGGQTASIEMIKQMLKGGEGVQINAGPRATIEFGRE
jgi:hypothetical protein